MINQSHMSAVFLLPLCVSVFHIFSLNSENLQTNRQRVSATRPRDIINAETTLRVQHDSSAAAASHVSSHVAASLQQLGFIFTAPLRHSEVRFLRLVFRWAVRSVHTVEFLPKYASGRQSSSGSRGRTPNTRPVCVTHDTVQTGSVLYHLSSPPDGFHP